MLSTIIKTETTFYKYFRHSLSLLLLLAYVNSLQSGPRGKTIAESSGLPPSITITASSNNICYGSSITFTATTVNAGSYPV